MIIYIFQFEGLSIRIQQFQFEFLSLFVKYIWNILNILPKMEL